MDQLENHGPLLRELRKRAGISLQNLAGKIGRSSGWLSEVENGIGTCRLSTREFDRIVDVLGFTKDRHLFKTWMAGLKNQERSSKVFDGAVLKFIRLKQGLNLTAAAKKAGVSPGYLCKVEKGTKPATLNVRNQLMIAYGYSPTSFKNLSTDPVRSKAVPSAFKFEILLQNISSEAAERIFQAALDDHKRQWPA
jgi:transcriptional regulator with XRE-family HTH domain